MEQQKNEYVFGQLGWLTNMKKKLSDDENYKEVNSDERPQKRARKETVLKKRNSSFQTKDDEERWEWLVDIRDEHGRRPGEDNYDPRTLFIPSSAYAKLKPFEKQYWDIKRKHNDIILFFKKGKFYELYEHDAGNV